MNEYVALTFDVQYMDDTYDLEAGTDVDRWSVGARMTVQF